MDLQHMVDDMHRHFGISYEGPPRHLPPDERLFRVKCLQEELDEYKSADTLVEEYDALLDLLTFVLGTFHRQGFNTEMGLREVTAANLRKEVGGNEKRDNFSIDLVKPEGWFGPEQALQNIINAQIQAWDSIR